VCLIIACGLACSHRENPQASYEHAYKTFVHGDLRESQAEAHRQWQRLEDLSPDWAWKFRILEANSLLWQGMYAQALATVDSPPTRPRGRDSLIEILAIKGVARARLHQFPEAEEELEQATQMCQASSETTCGDVIRARGVLAVQNGHPEAAKQLFQQTLQFARVHNDHFLESTALLNLGLTSLREGHFDEAIDWTEAAYEVSTALGAEDIAQTALGNRGWAYYNLGDLEKSLELSLAAEKRAIQAGDVIDQLIWITAAGNVYASQGDLAAATQSYLKALDLANKTGGKEAIYDAYRALALVSVESGDLGEARKYSDQASEMARADNNRLDELYPLLVKGLIAAQSRDQVEAERIFHEVENDPKNNASLKFRAEQALARLYEDQGRSVAADREYQTAIQTIEASRSALKRDDSKLPFSNNARHVYDDYVHFLVASKKPDDALRWADFSRARTLAEGLGLPAKTGPALDARQIARRAGGTLLFYWLGEKQSYLWAITPQRSSLFTLPPGKEIDGLVRRYSEALKGQDVLASADKSGQAIYQTLIEPARELVKKDVKVFVIPDGSLNNLNFETLLVSDTDAPQPKLHYWIEDVTIANASSLRVLAAVHTGNEKRDRSLLLVGDSVAPNDEYRELPQAAAQMKSVARHFSAGEQEILTREQATPSAYLASSPEKFSYIHFVAHGTASRLSPLDSAIVLSKDSAQDDSFKLYARVIKGQKLSADLVTISACYSAGARTYSGEGLVGLSWAFLAAGAHNVVAALWDVSDASTAQLMDRFYDELNKGVHADAALRTAKLSLLRGKEFHNPFYWAPFQLYGRLA
jgi:CHAT domain-containing protein/Flp pilus assembly protein TadD